MDRRFGTPVAAAFGNKPVSIPLCIYGSPGRQDAGCELYAQLCPDAQHHDAKRGWRRVDPESRRSELGNQPRWVSNGFEYKRMAGAKYGRRLSLWRTILLQY